MSLKVRNLYIQLIQETRRATQKRYEKEFKGLCLAISKHLLTAMEYANWGDELLPSDTKRKEMMIRFWRLALAACSPEGKKFYETCGEPYLLCNAVRLQSVFAAVASGVKFTVHRDEAKFAAEKIEKVCKDLYEEASRALLPPPVNHNVVHLARFAAERLHRKRPASS